MKVYRVYDDEWEQIMGEGQLCEFATYRLGMDNVFVNDDHEGEDISNDVLKAIEDYNATGQEVKDIKLAIKVLNEVCFDVEELELY